LWYRFWYWLFPPINPEDIGEPVSPYRTLKFFAGLVIVGLVLAAANLALTHQFWLSLAFWPVSVVLMIVLAMMYGVMVSLNEGEGVDIDRWGGFHHSLFQYRGHVVLDRKMMELLNTTLQTRYLVGSFVQVATISARLREGGTNPNPAVLGKFMSYARAQERWNKPFGGLRVVGWPWVDRIHTIVFPSEEIVEEVVDGEKRYVRRKVTRTSTRLLLTDIPKRLLLEGMETAAITSQSDGDSSGYGFPVDLLVEPYVRVSHMYLAVYRTPEGWARILTSLLHPVALGVVRGIEAGKVSKRLSEISQSVIESLRTETSDPTIGAESLSSRYGLDLIRFLVQDTQMSQLEDDELLQLPTTSHLKGRAREIESVYDANVIRNVRTAEADGVKLMVEAASGDPETARLAIKARAATETKGTVILTLGGDDKAAIDPGQQVLIERFDRLAEAIRGQKGKKKGAGGADSDVPDTSDEDEEVKK
jgi:hypothetical protein